MLSLTGIPPTAGFWGKFYLFSAVVDAGQTWLAVIAVVMSAVSAFYYLRVVWYMYFEPSPAAVAVAGGPDSGVAIVATGAEEQAGGLAFSEAPVSTGSPPTSAASRPVAALEAEAAAAIAVPVAPDAGSGAAMLVAAIGTLFIGIWPQGLLWAADGAVRLISGG
jgi:NADH:ubiquinone oxidoreductase subunit 2 (subunit N)